MTSASSRTDILVRTSTTLAIAAVGGFAVSLLGLPAAWLIGASVAVALAGLFGVQVMVPNWLRDVAFLLTGISMGASVSEDSLTLIMQWPITLAALTLELILIVATTGYMLRKLFGLDPGTAYMSSFPGQLSFVVGIAAAGVGDPRQIVIIQVIRILMLMICVPIGTLFLPVGHFAPPGIPVATIETLLIVAAVCTVAGWIFTRLRVPAGYALGAMVASIAMKFTGNFDGTMPTPLLLGTFIMIGAVIGARFSGISFEEFRKAAFGGLIATAMTVGITTLVAFAASGFVDMPFGQIWLGLAPGALEGMGALGIALGFDTAFIAAHHVARLLLLIIAIPVVVLLIKSGQKPPVSP